jgi:hypothetical protein
MDRRMSSLVLDDYKEFVCPDGDAAFQARTQAKLAMAKGDWAAALACWQRQSQEPADLIELLLVARGLVDQKNERALGYLDQLRTWLPTEADALLAQLCWRKNALDEGFDLAIRSFARFRTDPWPMELVMESTLKMALFATKHPGQEKQAARLLQVLQQPFAVGALDCERLYARLEVALHLDNVSQSHQTRGVLAEVEQFVPWTRPFLQLRASSYSRAADIRSVRAARDLAEYEANEARPFMFSTRGEIAAANPFSIFPSLLPPLGDHVHAREKPVSGRNAGAH